MIPDFSKNTISFEQQKILLAGDASRILFGSRSSSQLPCEICENIPQALKMLSDQNFTKVLIEMRCGNVVSALQAVKDIKPHIRIELLANMLEEPEAVRLTRRSNGTGRAADNYHIVPISREVFETDILGSVQIDSGQLILPAQTDSKDERIKILEKLATEDDLTGAKNRRYLLAFLSQLITRSKANAVRITLLLFDIDNFKHYNDQFGHSMGDNILRQAADMMRKCCRKQDVIARIGGDEFAVIFWDFPEVDFQRGNDDRRIDKVAHPHEAVKVAERFINSINSGRLPSLGPTGEGELTISGGLAAFPDDGQTIQELFDQADSALLEAKRNGKNRIYIVGQPEKVISQ